MGKATTTAVTYEAEAIRNAREYAGDAARRVKKLKGRVAELEAAVRTLKAERDQLIGVLQIAVERSGDIEHLPAWVDAACDLLNQGFLKVDRAALLPGGKDGST